jgi:hypothetical protein
MTEHKDMSPDALRLLMESLGDTLFSEQTDHRGVVAILATETLKFRDKLKEETGTVLTVQDTREALNALESYLINHEIPKDLTSEQHALVQIWIDRLTMFKKP